MKDPDRPDPSRRSVIAGAAAGAAAGLVTLGRKPAPAEAARPAHIRKHHWGMTIDLDRCTGCGACTVACREENNVAVVGPGDENTGARPEWMSLLWREPDSGHGLPELLPFPCQHCVDAPCAKVCPVGATYKDEEGITAQIWDRCIGCRYCMVACPYGRRTFNWRTPEWPNAMVQMLNPDVATRARGIVEKCTFCHHRIQRVKEEAEMQGRGPTDAEVQRLTACATACPAEAITFGDLNDPDAAVTRQADSPRAYRLLENLGTKPSVVYLKRDRRT